MAIEIVDFPINSMVLFNSYVKLPEGSLCLSTQSIVTSVGADPGTNTPCWRRSDKFQCWFQSGGFSSGKPSHPLHLTQISDPKKMVESWKYVANRCK